MRWHIARFSRQQACGLSREGLCTLRAPRAIKMTADEVNADMTFALLHNA